MVRPLYRETEKTLSKESLIRVLNMQHFFYYFLHPKVVASRMLVQYGTWLPEKTFLKWKFRLIMGYKLNLKNPQTFSEKLQWLKLYNRRPEYTKMVDKVSAKDYVASIIGERYIIPTLGIWNSVEEIEWEKLPNQFVVKSTGDSGGVVVCKDKKMFDKQTAIKKLKKLGERSYYKYNKEYPYKDVPHRYIAEEYMVDESGDELKDYKFFCFDGKPQFLFVATGRQKNDTRFDFYDTDFNHIPVINGHPNSDVFPTKPQNFTEMLEVARKLSQGIPHVRIDLYNIKGKVLFGEMTFFHWSGMMPFEPIEWDYIFGEYLKLPVNNGI